MKKLEGYCNCPSKNYGILKHGSGNVVGRGEGRLSKKMDVGLIGVFRISHPG